MRNEVIRNRPLVVETGTRSKKAIEICPKSRFEILPRLDSKLLLHQGIIYQSERKTLNSNFII